MLKLQSNLAQITLMWRGDLDRECALTSVRLASGNFHNKKTILVGESPKEKNEKWVRLVEELKNYLEEGTPISTIEFELLDCSQFSDFQKEVYRVTCFIPFGETRTYAWVAARLGQPRACRAVGQALRRNPFPILIPCHRVVAAKAGVGGFMGKISDGDPEVTLKRRLIEAEERYLNPFFSFVLEPAH